MKKILNIAGVVILALIVIGIFTSGSKNKSSSEIKDAFNKGQEKATETIQKNLGFSKEDALKKVQDYKITTDLKSPDISKGTTLLEVYEIKGKVPAVENQGWFSEETNDEGKYIIGYRQMVSGNLLQEPRWEVTEDVIKALNGKAISITPELQ